jgi:hypothetical protein
MSKFRIKLKLQGLEMEVEGTRDDLPAIRRSLGQQFEGILNPSTEIAEGRPLTLEAARTNNASVEEEGSRRKRKTRTSQNRTSSSDGTAEEIPIDWKHDPAKYGSPLQSWVSAQKAIWLLYVAAQEASVHEVSGSRIAVTFNKHFRQAGPVSTGHVNRDLGRLKAARDGQPPLVSEDTTKTPPLWFLIEAGSKEAQKLVLEALGKK